MYIFGKCRLKRKKKKLYFTLRRVFAPPCVRDGALTPQRQSRHCLRCSGHKKITTINACFRSFHSELSPFFFFFARLNRSRRAEENARIEPGVRETHFYSPGLLTGVNPIDCNGDAADRSLVKTLRQTVDRVSRETFFSNSSSDEFSVRFSSTTLPSTTYKACGSLAVPE